jgi:hypothetical protein
MVGRLGTVLYWIGCIIAGLTASIAGLLFMSEGYARKDGPIVTGFILVIAFVIWLAGYALRYILSGPKELTAPVGEQGKSWEETYATRIHMALPEADRLGEMTPEKLRIPSAALNRFYEKALLMREAICFVAFSSVAAPETKLPPVLMAYARLVARRLNARGMLADPDAFADASLSDVNRLFTEPYAWAQDWLAEFRNDPNDTYMVALFAEHCQKLFHAYRETIQDTYHDVAGLHAQ